MQSSIDSYDGIKLNIKTISMVQKKPKWYICLIIDLRIYESCFLKEHMHEENAHTSQDCIYRELCSGIVKDL